MTYEPDTNRITLPKTKLFVSEGRLIRQSASKETISDIAVDSITEVSVRMETDWPAVIIPIALFAVAGACKWFIPSGTLGWLLCIAVAVVGLLSFLGLKRPLLTVRTGDGKATFEVKDAFSDAEAFALSLRQQLNGRGS